MTYNQFKKFRLSLYVRACNFKAKLLQEDYFFKEREISIKLRGKAFFAFVHRLVSEKYAVIMRNKLLNNGFIYTQTSKLVFWG